MNNNEGVDTGTGTGPALSSPAPTHRETSVDAFMIHKTPVWFEGIVGFWDERLKNLMNDSQLELYKMNWRDKEDDRRGGKGRNDFIAKMSTEEVGGMQVAKVFSARSLKDAEENANKVIVDRIFLNMLYRKPNHREGMTFHVPIGNIAYIPTFQCQAIMSSVIWFCNRCDQLTFTSDISKILDKAITVVFDAYNEYYAKHATFVKLKLPKARGRSALNNTCAVIGELLKTKSLYNPVRDRKATQWRTVAQHWMEMYLWQFRPPSRMLSSIHYIARLSSADSSKTERLAYARFGVVLPIRRETVRNVNYLAIHPKLDIPFFYCNINCMIQCLYFYVVSEGEPSPDYIYKGFWCVDEGNHLTKPCRETVLDLVWEDEQEHSDLSVSGTPSMGSPIVVNKALTPLACKGLQGSASAPPRNHQVVLEFDTGEPEEFSQLTTVQHEDTRVLKRKAESDAKKPPPDHYEYDRENTPFPSGFGKDDMVYQLRDYGRSIQGEIKNWLRVTKTNVLASDEHLHASLILEARNQIMQMLAFSKRWKQETKNFLVFFGTLLVANIALEEEHNLQNCKDRTTTLAGIEIIPRHRQMLKDCSGYPERFGNLYQRFYHQCFVPAINSAVVEDPPYFRLHLHEPFKENAWKVMKSKIAFTPFSKNGATFPDNISEDKEKEWKLPGQTRPRYLYQHQRKALFTMGYGYYCEHKPGHHKSDHDMEMYEEKVQSPVQSPSEEESEEDQWEDSGEDNEEDNEEHKKEGSEEEVDTNGETEEQVQVQNSSEKEN